MQRIAVLFLCVLASPQIAIAHHSSSPHFDADKPITIEGVITKFRFVNPHAYLYVDVTDSAGNVTNWNCEMSAASQLRRFGWTADLFKTGATVRIDGQAARRDPAGCSFQSGLLEDGTRIARNGNISQEELVADELPQVNEVDLMSIFGNWQSIPRQRGRGAGGGNAGRGGRTPPSLTDAGAAAVATYDSRFDDPALECSPSSIIRVWGEPRAVNVIELVDDTIVIRHEFMDTVRTVHLNTSKPPDGYKPGLTGYSVGRFEGSDFLIDTVGFKAGVLTPHPGLLHSDAMRIVERLSLSEDGSELRREYAVTDPLYLQEPVTGTSSWRRTDLPLTAYNCTELSGVSKIRPDTND